jgi:hypothetical protein
MKIPIHDPKAFHHAHINSQAEELLNQIRELDTAISRMLIVAQALKSQINKQ